MHEEDTSGWKLSRGHTAALHKRSLACSLPLKATPKKTSSPDQPERRVAANLAHGVELRLAVPCQPYLAGPPHARAAHLQRQGAAHRVRGCGAELHAACRDGPCPIRAHWEVQRRGLRRGSHVVAADPRADRTRAAAPLAVQPADP